MQIWTSRRRLEDAGYDCHASRSVQTSAGLALKRSYVDGTTDAAGMVVFTVGFTRKPAKRFFELVRDSGAKRIVDVRLNNSSQLSGFAKKDDLAFFLAEICGVAYVHAPDLAPTADMLKAYRAGQMDWATYERRFLDLMRERRIEETMSKHLVADGCLLCSEDQPQHCHRRLVAEYLRDQWGGVDIEHLGSRAVL